MTFREIDFGAGARDPGQSAPAVLAAAQAPTATLENLPEHHLVVDGNKAVAVFAWEDAPASLRSYVPSRGNTAAKWVALVPANYRHSLAWIDQSPYFATKSLDVYPLTTGQKVYVGT